MNTHRKLILLALAAAVTACAFPLEKQTAPAASSEIPRSAEEHPQTPQEMTAPKQAAEPSAPAAMAPLDHPAAAPSETAPAAAPGPATAPEMKMPEETPPATTPRVSAPVPEAAPESMAMPAMTGSAVPRKAITVVADNVPRKFALTVGKKDPSHPFYGRGHDMGFIVDGVQGEELVLTRGVTYTFLVNTNVQHDFYFTTSPVGRGAGTVTDGIKGQFTYRGIVTFTPTASTPAVMYYGCRNHQYMGGKIHIAMAGDAVTVGGEQAEAPKISGEQNAVTEAQVKQKLSYAEMLLASSPAVKRAAAGDNAKAKNLLAQANQQLTNAKSALAGGDKAAALQAVDETLRLVSAVGRMAPAEAGQDYKARYGELLEQLHGFDKSYQKNLARGITPKPGKELNKAAYDSLVKEAEGFAAKEQYEEAVKQIKGANEMLTAALAALLESQTVVYDKNFATPQEEYEFELSRYGSYEELIPLAIEQRKPTEQTVATMNDLAKRAKEIHDEGVALAAKGDHKMAIMALQAATERLQQALHLAGVQ